MSAILISALVIWLLVLSIAHGWTVLAIFLVWVLLLGILGGIRDLIGTNSQG